MTGTGTTDGADSARAHAEAPPLRVSDTDRLATVRVLQDAMARGLLTPDEGSERMAAAFAAAHLADLVPLTADLPGGRAVAPGWRPLGRMAVEQVRTSLHDPGTGRLTPARTAVALVPLLLVVMLVGALAADLLGGGPGRGGGRGGGFGRD